MNKYIYLVEYSLKILLQLTGVLGSIIYNIVNKNMAFSFVQK